MLIDEIAQYLETAGAGIYSSDANRTIFIGNMPDDDTVEDSVLTIYDSSGLPGDKDVKDLLFPSFQVVIRDIQLDTGEARTNQIRNLLNNLYNLQFVSNGTYIYKCNLTANGGHIGRDEKGRDLFSLNFQLEVRGLTD